MLFNEELSGSPNFINTLNLELRASFAVTKTPPGWASDTDNTNYILWYSTGRQFNIPPGGSLTGFTISSQTEVADPTPFTITSWNHTSNAAGLVLIGAVLTVPRTVSVVRKSY